MPLPPLYSTRFCVLNSFGTDSVAYTVRDGFIIVVRDISGAIYPGSIEDAQCEAVYTAGNTICFFQTPRGHNRQCQWRGRTVLFAGETLALNSYGTHPNYHLTASGYVLSAP